jgi:hypothetical protein
MDRKRDKNILPEYLSENMLRLIRLHQEPAAELPVLPGMHIFWVETQ